jgi:regulator of protease activity HflC (stomatin/prohibitin superfamily)
MIDLLLEILGTLGGGLGGVISGAIATFVLLSIGKGVFLGLLRLLGLYDIVNERRAHVYMLFGKVIGVIDQPGLHILPMKLGPRAFLVGILGERRIVDMRLDQRYLRSLPVNSEEGAPMGVGIWYEMFVSNPISYLFKNVDPQGSLAANVSNATIRTLSNMPLEQLLEDRHRMSQLVRNEVTDQSKEWGYALGSVYVRKVHFRDSEMIRQIESKVVNRLRQVTSAIKQDGANQVNVITNTAEKTAAVEFAKAQAIRPNIVGSVLQKINSDEDVSKAMFEILETQRLIESKGDLTLVPKDQGVLNQLIAAKQQ